MSEEVGAAALAPGPVDTAATSRRALGEAFTEGVVRVAGISAIVLVSLIFLFLLWMSLPAFRLVDAGALVGRRWYPIEDLFGLLPLLMGSALVTALAVAIALPLGIITAIFLAEIAPPWLRDLLKPTIELLSGIPSIVLGFVGWIALAPLVQRAGAPTGLSALTGGLILAYMALPTIISIAEDAIDAVPRSYREGALALGATPWQALWRVVIPAARTGLVMAVMLGIGRAVGETMAVMMVTGNAADLPLSPDFMLRSVRTMTATIAAEMGEVSRGSAHYHVLFTIGLMLFLITFAINSLASVLVRGRARRAG
jgi:phosphate transport system permease protein